MSEFIPTVLSFTLSLHRLCQFFCPRYKLQLSFTFRLCWVVRCALLSSTFHPVHAENSSSRTSILRFHVAETEDCHLQEPRDRRMWLLINYNPIYGGRGNKKRRPIYHGSMKNVTVVNSIRQYATGFPQALHHIPCAI